MKQREWYVHRQMVSFMREVVGHVLQMLVCGHSSVWSSLTASDLLSRLLKLIQSCRSACILLLYMLKEGGCWLWERGFEERNTPWAALCYLPVWKAAVPTSFKCPPPKLRPDPHGTPERASWSLIVATVLPCRFGDVCLHAPPVSGGN